MFSKEKVIGKLEIYKDYGEFTEKVSSYSNIITRGLGLTITSMMTAGSDKVKDKYAIRYAQLGTGVVDYQRVDAGSETRANFFKLSSPLSKTAYGRNLRHKLETRYQLVALEEFSTISNTQLTRQQGTFLKIPDTRTTVKDNTGINISLVIDKHTANNVILREVGLFCDDVSEDGLPESVLVAYKQFAPITKTNEFSLIFDWTIEIVQDNEVSWESAVTQTGITVPTSRRGTGGGQDVAPTMTYGVTLANPWLVELGLPLEEITPVATGILSGTYGFVGSTSFLIDPISGTVSANPAIVSGVGFVTVSAQPSSTNYGIQYNRIYYEVSNPKLIDDPLSLYLGQIAWTIPSGASQGVNTVIHAVMPVSSGDFTSGVWSTHTNWIVSGPGTSSLTASGFVAQVHNVVRDASGGRETVEVVFPTSIVGSAGEVQYYDIYSTSASLPTNTLTIPAYIQNNLYFYIKDLSGYQYKGDIWSGVATTSSILKDGPYKRVYRFYTRMLPESWATTSPTAEKKPFSLGLHAYLTIKKDDPIVGVDFRISNGNYDFRNIDSGKGIGTVIGNENQVLGNFYYSDLWFEVSTGVSAVSELERFSNVYFGNTYSDRDKYSLVIPHQSIPEWQISNAGPDGQQIPADLFPGIQYQTPDQKVLGFNIHGVGKLKKFQRRFRLFPTSSTDITYEYAKEIGQFGDVAFPSRKRTWWKIPKWGPTKDIAPLISDDFIGYKNFNDPYFGAQLGDSYYDNGPYKLNTVLPGMSGFNFLITNLYKYFEETAKTGLCRYDESSNANYSGNYGAIGTRGQNFINFAAYDSTSPTGYAGTNTTNSNYNWMYRIKTPFTSYGSRNLDIGGLAQIHLYPGMFLNNNYLRLLNAQSHFVTDRYFGIYDFSGVSINPGQVMSHYGIVSSVVPSPSIPIYEWGFGGYPSCKVVDDAGKPFFFPKIYGAKKSNSKLCEPYEDLLDSNIIKLIANPTTNSNGTPQIGNKNNYTLVNACKYAYYSMPINGCKFFNVIIDGYRPASPEHASRIFPLLHAITTLTNDPMWKEEFESVAGFYSILMNPYPSGVSMPIPTNVYSNGGISFGTDYSMSNFYDVLKNTAKAQGTGTIGRFDNVRFLAFGIGGPSMYYQIASDSWRTQNQLLFEYAASAFYYSYIKENGLIGSCQMGAQTGASPNPNDIIEVLAAGHSFSSVSVDPTKTFWLYNPSAQTFARGTPAGDVTWENPPPPAYPSLIKSTQDTELPVYLQGAIFGKQNYWVTVMQSHYQVYMFRCLVKSVKQFDSVIASGLNNACKLVSKTLFVDAFHNFSGCAEMPEIANILNDYSGGSIRSAINSTANDRNILRRYTVGGLPLNPVDTTRTQGGPPHFILSNTNSWKYIPWRRGTDIYGKGDFTGGVVASGFSGGDFNKIPSRSGFIREDGHSTLAIAAMIEAQDNIDNLNTSSFYLNRSAWFGENYYNISNTLDPLWTANQYRTVLNYALSRARTIAPVGENNPTGYFYIAPLIAYIQYVLGINGNNS